MSVTTQEQLSVSTTSQHTRFSRLLLVDDNESLLKTLAQTFEDEGFTVTSCATAAEALGHIQHQEFDVAVVDLRLPDMKGTQLLEEFKNLGSRVRVIINTGYGEFDSAKDAINLGAFAYLEKVGDPGDLIRQVHRARRSHLEHYADNLETAVAERTAELSESEKKLRLVFDNAPVCLWHEDFSGVKQRIDSLSREGIEDFREYFENHPDEVAECAKLVAILDVNYASVRLHRATNKRELIESLGRTYSEDSYGVFREELIALAHGNISFKSDAVVTTMDGARIDVLLRTFVDPDSSNWSSVYVAITDMTERKQMEEEKEVLQTHLRHAQKIDAVGQLASGVAHEFNNILVGILGNADLLLISAGDSLPDNFVRPLKNIKRASTRAADLTKQLLCFARKKNSNVSLFDVNQVISDSETMLHRLVGTKIKLVTQLAFEPVLVRADESNVEQAITNLVMNARDAMPHGGTLTIQSDTKQFGANEVAPNCKPGSYVLLSIVDDGCGISPEVKERIFEPFFTTKDVGEGTGLGLSTVFADVNHSGGFITVDSRVGEGTKFCIHLPQVYGAIEPTDVGNEDSSLSLGGDETILVCDDEELALNSMAALLSSLNYTVICASGPYEAIELAKTHDGPISLLLSDISMPRMNGIQLGNEISQLIPEIKVVLTSGYAEDAFRTGEWENEHFEYIQKPAPYDILSRTIRRVLDEEKVSVG